MSSAPNRLRSLGGHQKTSLSELESACATSSIIPAIGAKSSVEGIGRAYCSKDEAGYQRGAAVRRR